MGIGGLGGAHISYISTGHGDLDCSIESKKDFQTSGLGQEHLIARLLYLVANGCLLDN